jgi:hypothetical protein
MSLGVPLHDALHEKQAPHSLCGACSLEVPATLIEPECEIDCFLLRISGQRLAYAPCLTLGFFFRHVEASFDPTITELEQHHSRSFNHYCGVERCEDFGIKPRVRPSALR